VTRAAFEVWDNRTGSIHGPECVSRHAFLDEAERSCLNDRGRLLTIYDGMDRVAGMFRDGKRVTDETVSGERKCICPDPLDGRNDLACSIHGRAAFFDSDF
jgi:hypothetical protein